MRAHDNPALDRAAHPRMLEGLSSEIGERLRDARKEAGLSQEQLGEVLDYAATMISAFETGRRRMKLEDLARVCIALDKEPGYFLRTAAVPRKQPETSVALKLRAELAELPSTDLRDSLGRFLDEIDREKPPESRVPSLAHLKPEAAARKVRDRCGVRAPQIEMEAVLEALEVPLYRRKFPDALSALVVDAGEERYAIAVNSRHHPHRRRFSIAHELGHAVLRHECDYYLDYWGEDAWEPPDYRYFDEREANQFAAALLMDDRALRKDFANGIQDTHQLAERYGVSEAAMNFRLIYLGLTS
jgi:Zn-dependent peptidase ImmA (M78 family)/DNA-binding XRE family transcriptional regulator